MKKIIHTLLVLLLVFLLGACSTNGASSTDAAGGATVNVAETLTAASTGQATTTDSSAVTVQDDLNIDLTNAVIAEIALQGESITVQGSGATVNDTTVTITAAGYYRLSGTLNNGQVRVDSADDGDVVLILNGAAIHCETGAPIYVVNAGDVTILLADGTENRVSDGSTYLAETNATGEPDAAIFSNDDLSIGGLGALTVTANFNNGIAGQDDLTIAGGRITVIAVTDGIKGRDSLTIENGVITVTAGADGLQANNDEDAAQGYIEIKGGTVTVTAGLDGIQAETDLLVSGGELTIVTGGGSVNGGGQAQPGFGDWGMGNNAAADDAAPSAKGLKAGNALTITGGTIHIDSADDALHANNSLTVEGGTFLLASGDDAMHADTSLTVNGGEIGIAQSYEGIESQFITINGGTIHLLASDDGINGSNGSGSAAGAGPGGGFDMAGDCSLAINGGYVFVDANGDGLDINGPITMTAGTVIVNGPTNDGNGPVDYTGEFTITGGTLIAAGSSGMAMAPSASSTQYSVLYVFPAQQAQGTLVHIETASGEEILTFLPTKTYQSVLISSPAIQNGITLVIATGGSPAGSATDGLYSGGSTSGGAQVASLAITSVITSNGGMGGGFPGGGGHPRP